MKQRCRMDSSRRIYLIIFTIVVFFYLLFITDNLIQNKTVLLFPKYINLYNSITWTFVVNHTGLLNNNSSCTPIKRAPHAVKFYKLSSSYYEYRYELNKQSMSTNESRLILLLTGRRRACLDWWDLSIGEKILSKMRSSGFSILTICTKKKDYNIAMPIQNNRDVYQIYITLQRWMKDVYYKHFQHYPRLYLFGISQGARMCSLLCRVLPVQAQILYVYPGYHPSLLLHSDHERSMLNRLILDPVFANWFYFDYCTQTKTSTNRSCPFHHRTKNYFNPVPPTYFIHAKNDRSLTLANYTKIISDILKNAFHLGGQLLTENNTIKLSIAHPMTITPYYMKENFDKWSCKPWSSQFFYEHFINSTYRTHNSKSKTCWCIDRNFLYFNRYPNITKTWSKTKQEKYRDYVKDIHTFRIDICQQICGNLLVRHSMISHHIVKTLGWLNEIDHRRSWHKIQDLLHRPLRIWMYNKSELVQNLNYRISRNTSCGRIDLANQMYSPEYFLQDYFQRLQRLYPLSQHDLIWSKNPLLADYYIIPHDYTCIAVDHYRSTLTNEEYNSFYERFNQDYFLPLLINVRQRFPYWSMTSGSNHLIAFTLGKNMGVIQNSRIENNLKRVIQLAYTGFRHDVLSNSSQRLYVHRNRTPIYRHQYDILIPPFNRLQRLNVKSILDEYDWNSWYRQKINLLFFSGTINKSISHASIRQRLLSFSREDTDEGKKYENKITIDEKQWTTIKLIDGHLSPANYVESIRSTIFHLCPEGFSPWSPRIYESLSLGTIPLILAESIVLPFERFINWRSLSAKLNASNMSNMIDSIMKIPQFDVYIEEKLTNARRYFHAFRWPYSPIDDKYDQHLFLPEEDRHGTTRNVFYYLSLELRCRRLEQFHGLTFDSFSKESINARRRVCRKYATICPCYDDQRSSTLDEYM